MRWLPLGLVFTACCLCLAGCTPGYPEVAPVSGKVTFSGRPVAGGEVQFLASDGHMAIGPIEADGSYRLTTFRPDDGATIGTHRVAIISPKGLLENYGASAVSIPPKYEDPATSGLTRRIKPGTNRIDFYLTLGDDDEETEPEETDTPTAAPVSGVITLDGKPLWGGEIEFFPKEGRPSFGTIRTNGRYRLSTFEPNDGAVPGVYRVAITSRPTRKPPAGSATAPVADRYGNPDTSGLTAVVQSGSNTIDFSLKSNAE